jgi:ribosomal protein S18 acetylase RimI-like enzyme
VDDGRRCLDFLRRHAHALARRVEPLPYGYALLNDELPRVWDLNVVWVDDAAAGAEAILSDAERVLGGAGLAHRQIELPDAAAGRRLQRAFARAGYGSSEHVIMALRRPEALRSSEVGVEELTPEDAAAWTADEIRRSRVPAPDEEECREVGRLKLLLAEHGARFFGVCRGGAVVSACDLYVREGIGQIEDVRTLEEHRGGGLGRAVTAHAAREALCAGCELVFLVAETDDWPKELYARLGFEPVARSWLFRRLPATRART